MHPKPCSTLFVTPLAWAFVDHGHSKDLDKHKPKSVGATSIIVSRSHAGKVGTVAKEAFGDNTVVIPAGGAGGYTIMLHNSVFILRITASFNR